MGTNHLTVQWLRKYPSTQASTMTMRFLCLIALLPYLLCQDGPVEPTREPEPEPEPEAECMDGMEDLYSTETCDMLPAMMKPRAVPTTRTTCAKGTRRNAS